MFRKRDSRLLGGDHPLRQQLRTVVLPPGARAVGRTIRELGWTRARCSSMRCVATASWDGIRIPTTRLREGDVLMLWGAPEDLEQDESRLLMG